MKLNDAIELVKDGFSHADCPDGWEECIAARSIVYHLLDPTPVTGEALVAMGWSKANGHEIYASPEQDDICGQPTRIVWKSFMGPDDFQVNGKYVSTMDTIGQVRCACLAFGIPMREEA